MALTAWAHTMFYWKVRKYSAKNHKNYPLHLLSPLAVDGVAQNHDWIVNYSQSLNRTETHRHQRTVRWHDRTTFRRFDHHRQTSLRFAHNWTLIAWDDWLNHEGHAPTQKSTWTQDTTTKTEKKTMNQILLSIYLCEFAYTCPYYRRDSYTCNHKGGRYCGKWRQLKEQQ